MINMYYLFGIILIANYVPFGFAQLANVPPFMASESCVQIYNVPKHSVRCDPSPHVVDHINQIGETVDHQMDDIRQLQADVEVLDPNTPRPIPDEIVERLDTVDELKERTAAHTEVLTRLDEQLDALSERLETAESAEKEQIVELMQQQAQLMQLTGEQSNATLHEEYVSQLVNLTNRLHTEIATLQTHVDKTLVEMSLTVQNAIASTQDTTRAFIQELREFLNAKINRVDQELNVTISRSTEHQHRTSANEASIELFLAWFEQLNMTQIENVNQIVSLSDQLQILEHKHALRKEETGDLSEQNNLTNVSMQSVMMEQDQMNERLRLCNDNTVELASKVEQLAEQLHRQQHLLPRTLRAEDCHDILTYYQPVSGVYKISARPISESFEVYCDLSTATGREVGWTIIQRRDTGKEDFYRTWQEYKDGFGAINSEYWLGFTKIRAIIDGRKYILRIDLLDWSDRWLHAEYSEFSVSTEEELYRLHIGSYSGDAGDALSYHDGAYFSTYDHTNDESGGVCPELCGGGWWYRNCYHSNLNGRYYEGGHYRSDVWGDGIVWRNVFDTNLYSFKAVLIKIRPALE